MRKYMSIKMKKVVQTTLLVVIFSHFALAQAPETQFNGFGHLDFGYRPGDSSNAYFSLGEHDMFINSKLRENISFLGEFVIRYNENAATKFLPSIERAFMKINYKGNHNIIAGKIHSPVNYWNDVYHHGRLFSFR